MLEIPESFHIAQQITQYLAGREVAAVQAAVSPHKFAWYQGDPADYASLFTGKRVRSARPVGGMLEIDFGGVLLVLSEGAGPLYLDPASETSAKHQLLLGFAGGGSLVVTVRMYGGILAFPEGAGENEYYLIAKGKPFPLSSAFDEAYFACILQADGMEKLSAKAFLATEQRVPGLGNGVLQDILYHAGVHPKRKIADLDQDTRAKLFISVKDTLQEMARLGGRDTENDLFGQPGGYATRCSKFTVGKPCGVCGYLIEKASYMGGSVYFCPGCQPL